MGRSRPAYPRRAYRRSLRRFLLENRALIAGLGALFFCLGGLEGIVVDGYLLGLVQGLLVAAFASLVLLAHVTNTGSLNQVSGAWAEDNTRASCSVVRVGVATSTAGWTTLRSAAEMSIILWLARAGGSPLTPNGTTATQLPRCWPGTPKRVREPPEGRVSSCGVSDIPVM